MSLASALKKQEETARKEEEKKLKEEEEIFLVRLIEETSEIIESDKKGRISPSSGCSYCPRQAFYSAFLHQKEWGADSGLYAAVGVATENYIAERLKRKDVLLGQGIRLWENTDLALGAELDMLIVSPKTQRITVIECKTCGDLPTKTKEYQLWQLQLYMAYYLCDGFMYYASRDVATYPAKKLKHKHFFYEFNPLDAKTAMCRSFVSHEAIKMKKIPPRNPLISAPTDSLKKYKQPHADCGFCPFAGKCWYDEETGFENMTSDEYAGILDEYNYLYYSKFFSKNAIQERREDLFSKISNPIDKDKFMDSFSKTVTTDIYVGV